MPKGRIVFGCQGEGYTKRKKIMKGTDPNSKSEVKQWNPAVAANASAIGKSGYAAINMYPISGLAGNTYENWYDYRLLPLNWPTVGANSYDRVGNSMFLRAFRFKGRIDVKGNLPQEFRWRIRLWRFKGGSPEYMTGNFAYQMTQYMKLFRNADDPGTNDSADTLHTRASHNFFKMFKKLPKTYDYETKVIASGVIPVSNVHTQVTGYIIGQENQYVGLNSQTISSDIRYTLPLDVKVKCNDRITWSRTSETSADLAANIVYCLSLEDNYGCGVTYVEPSVSATPVSWSWSNTATAWPVCFNFFARGYFTDD